MPFSRHRHLTSTRARGSAAALALALVAIAPASALATVSSFGANLSTPATIDTATGLTYPGTNVAVPPSASAPTGVVHINHDGADTALWNTALAGGASPAAPASGQVTSVALEGCAKPTAGGTPPLTQIHFQDLTPQPGGGVHVNVTTQPFDIPICGAPAPSGGVTSGSTVSTYVPTKFCVQAGDYVGFNDEGGFDPSFYPSGVPYLVMGAAAGVTDSYIRDMGTNNGATLTPTNVTTHDGFAVNTGREQMLSATLATGPDATPLCPGGTRGVKAPPPSAGQVGGPPAVGLHAQRDGVNHSRYVSVSLYCNQPSAPCAGSVMVTATPTNAASTRALAAAPINLPSSKSAKVQLRVAAQTLALIRKHGLSLPATLTVHLSTGPTYTQSITLYI